MIAKAKASRNSLVSESVPTALGRAKFHTFNIGPSQKAKSMDTPAPNSCGTCRLCCTVMRVEEFTPPLEDKPAFTPCQFLCKEGCSIYETRPRTCAVFECLWLSSQQFPKMEIPSSERPDRTGVVMTVNSKGNVTAHCRTPMAWRDEKTLRRLLHYNRTLQSSVTIVHGNGTTSVLNDDGSATLLKFIGVDPDTNEEMFTRER